VLDGRLCAGRSALLDARLAGGLEDRLAVGQWPTGCLVDRLPDALDDRRTGSLTHWTIDELAA
jgi:hypothetical protein